VAEFPIIMPTYLELLWSSPYRAFSYGKYSFNILTIYFTKSLPHVSVRTAPSLGRT
jgi:hypothetical protein